MAKFRNKSYSLKMNLKGVVKGAERGATAGMKKVATKIEKEIKRRAPVDTGQLKRSVKVTAVGGKKPRMAVKTVAYGLYVEKGTVNMDAQPFIAPVIQGQRQSIVSAIAKEGRKEFKKTVKKSKKRR